VPLHLTPLERQRARGRHPEQFAVHAREKSPEPPLVRHAEHDHARAFLRRKLAVVEVVAVERHQRPPQLARQPEMLDVAGAAQIGMLEDEQHVPAKLLAHESDDAARNIRVGIHARLVRDLFDERSQLRGQRAHYR